MRTRGKFSIFLIVALLSFNANSQKDFGRIKGDRRITSKALFDTSGNAGILLPGVNISNPLVNNFELNLKEEKFSLQGVMFHSEKTGITGNLKASGENENRTVSVFSGTAINPKFNLEGTLVFPIRTWIRYGQTEANKANLTSLKLSENMDEKQRNDAYNSIKDHHELYGGRRYHYLYFTFGLTVSGAKYYLIDTTASVEKMVKKKTFNGWQINGNLVHTSFSFKNKLLFINTLSFKYGEINNTGDLSEYSITQKQSFSSGTLGNLFERKKTGYVEEYITQEQGIVGYEANFYPLDPDKRRIGYLVGGEFVYQSKTPNYQNYYAGLNFPVDVKPDDGKKGQVFVSFIVALKDPSNQLKAPDFNVKDGISGIFRINLPIRMDFKTSERKK